MDKKQLMQEYKDLTGNKPFVGWSPEKIMLKIQEFKTKTGSKEAVFTSPAQAISVKEEKKEDVVEDNTSEKQRMEEARQINSMKFKTIHSIAPVFLEGKPYAVIDDKYVPWEEAEIIMLEREKEVIERKIKEAKAVKV